MDRKGTWRSEKPIDRCRYREHNILVFSDGGTRPGCSASAWTLGVMSRKDNELCYTPIIAAGIFFESPVSSFMAEAIALENACKELEGFVCSL